MSSPTLIELFRYPVKSMMGESLTATELTKAGLTGDRAWAVRDERRGGIRGGKKIPQLMTLSAQAGTDVPMITAPDGDSAAANSDGINQWLSDKLNHPVSLWPLLPAEQLDHYRRGAPDTEDFELELRTVFGRLPDEPIPDLSGFEELLEFESPPGTYFDAFPVSIMSRQSLESMDKLGSESCFDARRFRPNLLIDIPKSKLPFPEQEWVGATLSIGSVVLKVEATCPRCSMTTHGFADLPRDTEVMRQLVRHSEGNLGVYASVQTAGSLSINDTVEVT
jgi:uncharacterized protein YcbX